MLFKYVIGILKLHKNVIGSHFDMDSGFVDKLIVFATILSGLIMVMVIQDHDKLLFVEGLVGSFAAGLLVLVNGKKKD